MSEFQSRITANRRVLELVNGRNWREELMGMSRRSIARWAAANRIGTDAEVVECLLRISAKLFFLSNKSQQQITEEYLYLQGQVDALTRNLAEAMEKVSTGA